MRNYKFIEHTADIALEVRGKTVPELFMNSAEGLFSLIYPGRITRKIRESERHIHIKAETLEDLLIDWLNELISIFYTYHFLPKSYNIEVKAADVKVLKGIIKGSVDIDESKIAEEVKSAAYHNVKIKREAEGFRTIIIFDV
ncbi:MAG: hypothetical protein B1H08_05295 [Candidatus Omnitrophica bacterium 4484_171]|nr:MAG: hypothetical protein B1H08_05295 [Candidatus Omnitrophica bacterium 4484_171]RKX82934.1 MAG: hypothetical protein DRP57_08900 [Spirochaetota bacterium]